MIVCSREFNDPDPHYPDFSMTEVDVMSNAAYRLSVRKCLKTGKYQAYRDWHDPAKSVAHANALAYQPQSFSGDEGGFYDVEVVFEGSLMDVITYVNEEIRKVRTVPLGEGFGVCPHTGSWRERAVRCRD